VAVKKAVHFSWNEPLPDKYRWLLAGSLAVAYLAVSTIDSVTERKQAELSDRARINARAGSAIFLLVLAPAGGAMSGGAFLMLVTAVNVAQVVFDMMMAPLESSEHAELGTRTTAEAARERIEIGQRPSNARRIGEAVRKGAPSELRQDLYFYLIDGSWWRVGAVFTFTFIILNAFFAALYVLEPGSIANARPNNFVDAYYFSVQTMSTIGYGSLSPGSDWGNAIVTIEAVVGMVGVAVVTGLVFAKLSRPNSGVAFSQPLVITRMHGKDVLNFRAGNTRGNDVVDATMTLTVLMDELTPEGHHMRRLHDLRLVRNRSPLFRLTWSVMHEVDESSPLHGIDWSEPAAHIFALIATFVGHDGTYGQTTYARHIYDCDDLRVGQRFVDIIHELPDGRMMVDYGRFDDTEPDDAAQAAVGADDGRADATPEAKGPASEGA
jgi:inward rectifier potassium channel